MRKIGMMLALLWLAVSAVRGISYSSYSFSVNEGLSNPTAYCIVKDADGLIWIATKQGVDMYNGLSFKHYQLFAHSYRSIDDGIQISLYRSEDNRLWAFNDAGRIFLYNILSDNFKPFVNLREMNVEEQLCCLLQKGTSLYAGIDGGVVRLSLETNKVVSIKHGLPMVNTLICQPDGVMLAGTADGIYELSDDLKTAKLRKGTKGHNILTLYYDELTGTLWAGSDGRGVWRYAANELQSVGADGNPVRSIIRLDDSLLLVGIDGLGIYSVRPDGTDLQPFATGNDVEGRHIASTGVYSLLNDGGNIWCTTFSGGVSLLRNNNIFRWLYRTNVKTAAQNEARAFCEVNGELWSAYVMGLSRYDIAQQTLQPVLDEQSGFLAITADRQGRIWAGGYGIGIYRIDPATGLTEHIPSIDGNDEPDRIFALCCDPEGNVWAGGLNIRLTCIQSSGEKRYYDAGMVFSLCAIDRDRMLAGTAWGFCIINKRTGKVDNYQNDPERMEWRGSNKFNSVVATGGRMLWLASEGGGLLSYDLTDKKLQAYTVEDGLPSNYLTAFQPDTEGRLWISTESNGIFAFDMNTRRVTARVNQYNGIPLSAFYGNAACRLSTGEIVFGGDAGAIIFRPSDITTPTKQLSINFTRLLVGGKDVNMEDNPNIISSPLNQLMRVVLPNDQRSMAVDVCLNDIYNQTNMRLRYRLAGYIDEWQNVDPSGRITLTMLPPGHYQLELAVTPPGTDDVVLRRLSISVSQPFYLRWPALVLYALLLAAALFFVIRAFRRNAKK